MAERKVVPFDEFYYQLKLMYLFQKHPVCTYMYFIEYYNKTDESVIVICVSRPKSPSLSFQAEAGSLHELQSKRHHWKNYKFISVSTFFK
jgi:hypothetical protein